MPAEVLDAAEVQDVPVLLVRRFVGAEANIAEVAVAGHGSSSVDELDLLVLARLFVQGDDEFIHVEADGVSTLALANEDELLLLVEEHGLHPDTVVTAGALERDSGDLLHTPLHLR